ncbi:MAG: class I SAM-dependent methyltransferase [Thermodesulfobacteriota bacterium]
MEKRRDFKDWENYYRTEKVEAMAWYHPSLDHDFERALLEMDIHTGAVLDLGTGPGTQAVVLAEWGFNVTATDISETAVGEARGRAKRRGLEVECRQDDIRHTKLKGPFDIVFDRGCFHVMQPEEREGYVKTVAGLVRPGGYLFLKCFSVEETMEEGPYRFTPEEIRAVFGTSFNILSIRKSEFHGTLETFPKALFSVLRKP